MKTWDGYKKYVKENDAEGGKLIEEAETLSAIVSALIAKRNSMGLSQRELASMCGVPQSSVARIESFRTSPNLNTLLKIMRPLGLKLAVQSASPR